MRPAMLLVTLLAACSADDEIEMTFDPCSPLMLVPGPDTTASERAVIDEAGVAWGQVIATELAVGEPDERPWVSIVFESGDTFYRAIYWDAIGEIAISREKLRAAELPVALAHELGHAFGLLHVDPAERPSVMNVGNVDLAPTAEDGAAVAALWPACGR
jgi:hypothetical protein